MMTGFRVTLKNNILRMHGVDPGGYHLIDHVEHDGDVLVVVKAPGHNGWFSVGQQAYYPTVFSFARLMPISENSQSVDKPLYQFTRQKRIGFKGDYRVEEVFINITPGRHRGMVRALVTAMKRHALDKPEDWKKITHLDGVPIKEKGARPT